MTLAGVAGVACGPGAPACGAALGKVYELLTSLESDLKQYDDIDLD